MGKVSCACIRPVELQERISANEPLQVIDVREFPEFGAGHIICAGLLPLGELKARADELDRNTPLVCVCHSGKRSREAATKLRDLGFRAVAHLEGGMIAWEQNGLPLTRDTRVPWSLERQVRLTLGALLLAGLLLSRIWQWAIVVSWIIGTGMVLTSFIDRCGMAFLLAKAPWNKQREIAARR